MNYEYFRNIFKTEYNISFWTPAIDRCSTCLQFSEEIKLSTDLAEKSRLNILYKLHKLKSSQFHNKLKEKHDDKLTFSYDCRKNQVLTKIPDQKTYYSRQLYNFIVFCGSSKDGQNTNNIFKYTWLENQHKKGSNEIASRLWHWLKNIDLAGIKKIRLFLDGCGGQNKKQIILGMLSKWWVFWISKYSQLSRMYLSNCKTFFCTIWLCVRSLRKKDKKTRPSLILKNTCNYFGRKALFLKILLTVNALFFTGRPQ